MVFEELIAMNVTDFFDSFLADNARHSLKQFFIQKGEKDVSCDNWHEPVTPEDKIYDGKKVLR